MNSKNRKIKNPDYIEPSPEEYERLKEAIIRHFTDLQKLGKFKGDILAKTHDVLESCKKGWRNCPRKYEDRVRTKAKWKHAGGANLVTYGESKKIKAAKIKAEQQLVDSIGSKSGLLAAEDEVLTQIGRDQILKKLKPNDRKFWMARERYYRSEFEFNESSDFALLMELLSDELEHKRIIEMRLITDSPDDLVALSRASTECFSRMEKALKALGITREQRKDELDDSDGDIASLSVNLEKKKKAIEAIREKDAIERRDYLAKKHARGDTFIVDGLDRPLHNRIPDMNEIIKIEKEAGIDDG